MNSLSPESTTPVNNLSLLSKKAMNNLSLVSATPAVNFFAGFNASGAFLFTDIVDTSNKFIASIVVTSDNCSPMLMLLAMNLLLVSLSPVIIVHWCH
jgi:hypothetical protein